jgi:tRNA-splicing ligase RtcB
MKYIILDGQLPIASWCNNPEEGAITQAMNLANLPFAFRRIALMSDTHVGYGMPIGGVLATRGVIIPNAVGVDIGCGMCAVRSSATGIGTEALKRILWDIRKAVPVGFTHHQHAQNAGVMPHQSAPGVVTQREYQSALKQIGTLGGGNHFIEIQKGSDGFVWAMIHSGSRNLGKQVADHYNKVAVRYNESLSGSVPKKWDLAFLPLDSKEGLAYSEEMNYCVDFALANRKAMLARICECMGNVVELEFGEVINIAHNYARMEQHYGMNVLVHRKGATSARQGEFGIIPGSQGTSSYIVQGKGNPESFASCSHGAGRRMGRKEAQRSLDLKNEQRRLDERGILHSVHNAGDLDEAPGAYKDIATVMAEQSDLVDIVVKLEPMAVIKG